MKLFLTIFLLSAVFLAIPAQAGSDSSTVFLHEILGNFARFHLKRVTVFGKLSLQAEDFSLSTEGCARSDELPRGLIWIELFPALTQTSSESVVASARVQLKKYSRFHQRCVWVTGVYDRSVSIGWGGFAGGIKDIQGISEGDMPMSASGDIAQD